MEQSQKQENTLRVSLSPASPAIGSLPQRNRGKYLIVLQLGDFLTLVIE